MLNLKKSNIQFKDKPNPIKLVKRQSKLIIREEFKLKWTIPSNKTSASNRSLNSNKLIT